MARSCAKHSWRRMVHHPTTQNQPHTSYAYMCDILYAFACIMKVHGKAFMYEQWYIEQHNNIFVCRRIHLNEHDKISIEFVYSNEFCYKTNISAVMLRKNADTRLLDSSTSILWNSGFSWTLSRCSTGALLYSTNCLSPEAELPSSTAASYIVVTYLQVSSGVNQAFSCRNVVKIATAPSRKVDVYLPIFQHLMPKSPYFCW